MTESSEKPLSPIRPTNDEARSLSRKLIREARLCSLAVLHPENGMPFVSRTAICREGVPQPVSLISDLSLHTRALKANPACSVLVGEPTGKGDPLNQPRITLQCHASFVDRSMEAEFAVLYEAYVSAIPKAKVYADFLDFNFALFSIRSASLNGGFGKAYELEPGDLIDTE